MRKLTDEQLLADVEAYRAAGDNQALAAELLGISPNRLSERLAEARERGLYAGRMGTPQGMVTRECTLPKKGVVKRYLLTCAQTETKVYMPFWKNLVAMAEHYDAELLVSTFVYNKHSHGQKRKSKRVDTSAELNGGSVMADELDPAIREYVCNDRVDIAPRLTFAAELGILPTASHPLRGFEAYTYRKSTVVPHVKIALKSIAGMQSQGVKTLYTTGTCTQMNYIKRREGFKAEHWHQYGALLVEVTAEGDYWCRHVLQGPDDSLYDFTLRFKDGKLTNDAARVENIFWGDMHSRVLDQQVANACWKMPGNMLDTLKPKSQHHNDILDFSPNSHHTRKDPFESYFHYHNSERRSFTAELMVTAAEVVATTRKWCETYIVNSNHDRHPKRWLAEIDWRDDPENAELICELTKEVLVATRKDNKHFNLLEAALNRVGLKVAGPIYFMPEDPKKDDPGAITLKELDGGILNVHGDRGANGAQGTPSGLANLAQRINMADKHRREIFGHVYVAGLTGKLNMRYNKGFSSWSHASIVTYANGMRAIVDVWKGRWRA